MRILKISNMYPSKEKKYAGIFVRNQYDILAKKISSNDKLDIFVMERRFTGKVGSAIKYAAAFVRFTPYLFRKYDIVHLHYFFPLIWLVWIYKKIHRNTKVVVTFLGRDINAQVHKGNEFLYRRLAKCIDFSIPVGTTMAKAVSEKLNLSRIKILPCGVDGNVFFATPKAKKEYDFIFVGSFIYRKGIDTIIDAIKDLPSDSGIRFCFCGSGPYLEQLEELQKSNQIVIKQNQTQHQLRELLNASRFFMLMSRGEGFATATTEAFFCGIPVLTSDIDNFKEQVTEGINGFITPLEDVNSLTKKLLELKIMDDSTYQLYSKGALNSFRDASLNQVGDEIISIYSTLINEA